MDDVHDFGMTEQDFSHSRLISGEDLMASNSKQIFGQMALEDVAAAHQAKAFYSGSSYDNRMLNS